jgi:hypothetical protein
MSTAKVIPELIAGAAGNPLMYSLQVVGREYPHVLYSCQEMYGHVTCTCTYTFPPDLLMHTTFQSIVWCGGLQLLPWQYETDFGGNVYWGSSREYEMVLSIIRQALTLVRSLIVPVCTYVYTVTSTFVFARSLHMALNLLVWAGELFIAS